MTELKLDISEGAIANAIAVAVAEAFSPEKRDALLRDIIRAHMAYKENSYDKETILSKAVGSAVRRMAMEEVGKIIADMKPDVERIVGQYLGPAFRTSVLHSLENAIQSMSVSNLRINAVIENVDD